MSNRWHELFGGIHWLMGSPVAGLTMQWANTSRPDTPRADARQAVSESTEETLDSARDELIAADQHPYAGGHGR